MTPQEQKFVNEFIRTGNAAMAVVHSGIRDGRGPDKIAEELLTRPEIRAAIECSPRIESPVVVLDKDAVLADIHMVKDRAVEEGRLSEAINALKLISDLQGLRTTKVEVTQVGKAVKDMTDDELMSVLERMGKKKDCVDLLK